ncbi:DUF4345 domain-containing protein [Sphingomonas abietis]|uniref:DUF4345 domain-containing protein n=1 Tax=Sphingomonas abietis TaxID=3012344 RepID=A0ABY7NJV6_9SPHN|nr:DUF4345 domain-containing protein [Sphingomonas abietis]WBO21618.1 DUF4345 domain-containing protein [Sphingomonas abietis]
MIVEKRALQMVVAIACLVPFSVAIPSVLHGATTLKGLHAPVPRDLDSHFRYLSGIFLMLGIGFASCVPGIDRKGPRFRLLGAMVVTGGLARALSWAEIGAPSLGHQLGLVMELGVVPVLMLWQARVADICIATSTG